MPTPVPEFVIDASGVLTAYNGDGGEVVIPEGVTAIGSSVFQDNQTITGVFLPEGVTTIGQSAFSNCDGLTSVILPEGVTKVDAIAFYSCDRLERVTLPGTLKEAGCAAFQVCASLQCLVIPECVSHISADKLGVTDARRLVIVTPEGSAAAQWASEHGVCWINAK